MTEGQIKLVEKGRESFFNPIPHRDIDNMGLVLTQQSNSLHSPVEITSIILNLKALEEPANPDRKVSFTSSPNSPHRIEVDVSLGYAAFFQKIVTAIDKPFCILLPENCHIDFEAMNVVLKSMQDNKTDMAIAQMEDSSGCRSILPRRMEDLRFCSIVPAGTVVFTREHFVRTAQKLSAQTWDSWWHFDLVRMGASTGLVCFSNEVVTKSKQPLLAFRHAESLAPLRRAVTSPQPILEPVILVYGAIEASTSLYFDGLPADLQRQIRFYAPCDSLSDLPHLAAASAIIIVRDFEHMATSGLLELLDAMEVPMFWFTDDHLETLRPEYAAFRYYDSAAMKAFLSRMRAVFTSTSILAEIYQKLHREVVLWPLVFDETLAAGFSPASDPKCFRIGAFGGNFRRDSLLQDVMPAVQKLQDGVPPQLYLRTDLARGMENERVISMPFDSSYRQFVFRWQRLGLHVVAHPFGVTRNIGNKSFGSILTTRYLGAVPIVAHEAAQRGLGEDAGVVVTDRGAEAWEKSLRRVRDVEERRRLREVLDAWCRKEFSPEKSREPFSRLIQMIPPGPIDVEKRLSRALLHPKAKEILFSEPAPPLSSWEKIFGQRGKR